MAKLFLVLCASALFVQAITCACLGNGISNVGISNIGYSGWDNGLGNVGISNNGYSGCGNGLGYGNGYNAGLGLGAAAGLSSASNGGGLAVSSVSPLAPAGLSVISENELGGILAVSGALPFVSTVALEGQVPSAGSAGVQYSCGNGNIGIVSENVAAAGNGYGAGLGYGSGLGLGAGLGYGAGLGAGYGIGGVSGCGCNGGY